MVVVVVVAKSLGHRLCRMLWTKYNWLQRPWALDVRSKPVRNRPTPMNSNRPGLAGQSSEFRSQWENSIGRHSSCWPIFCRVQCLVSSAHSFWCRRAQFFSCWCHYAAPICHWERQRLLSNSKRKEKDKRYQHFCPVYGHFDRPHQNANRLWTAESHEEKEKIETKLITIIFVQTSWCLEKTLSHFRWCALVSNQMLFFSNLVVFKSLDTKEKLWFCTFRFRVNCKFFSIRKKIQCLFVCLS